jgi:hypothetical protein
MRRITAAVLALILFTSVAYSQVFAEVGDDNANDVAARQDAAAKRASEARKKQHDLDAAYKAALDKTKASTAPVDPWANVRPTDKPSSKR